VIKGELKANAVLLEAVHITVHPLTKILSRVSLIDSSDGTVYATVRSETPHSPDTWSKDTLAALETLKSLIEKDLAKVHLKSFEDKGTSLSSKSLVGLGEHLRRDEADSV